MPSEADASLTGLRSTHVDTVLRTCAAVIQQRGLWSPYMGEIFNETKRTLAPLCANDVSEPIVNLTDIMSDTGATLHLQAVRTRPILPNAPLQAFADALQSATRANNARVAAGAVEGAVAAPAADDKKRVRPKGSTRKGAAMSRILRLLHPPETLDELVRQWEDGVGSCPPLRAWTRDMRQDRKASLAHSKRKVVYAAFVACDKDVPTFEARYGPWTCFTAMHREVSRQNAASRSG